MAPALAEAERDSGPLLRHQLGQGLLQGQRPVGLRVGTVRTHRLPVMVALTGTGHGSGLPLRLAPGDREQPGFQTLRLPQAAKLGPAGQKGLLGKIISVGLVRAEAAQEGADRPLIPEARKARLKTPRIMATK